MRLLLANLSHYWKRPALIFWNLILGLMIFSQLIIGSRVKQGRENLSGMWLFTFFWIFLYAMYITAYQIEIRNKPASFCLPGHNKLSGNTLLSINLFWSILVGLTTGIFSPITPFEQFCFGIVVFMIYSMLFSLAAFLTCSFKSLPQWIFIFFIASPFIQSISRFDLRFLFRPEIVVGLIVTWVIVSYLSLRFCCRREIDRKFCGINYIGLGARYNISQLQKLKKKHFEGITESVDKVVDVFSQPFLRLIKQYQLRPLYTVACGSVYQSLCPFISLTLKSRGLNMLVILGLICIFGYYPAQTIDYIVWIILTMMFIGMDLQVHSTLVLIRGRKERYLSIAASMLTQLIVGLILSFTAVAAMQLLVPVMPNLHLYGRDVSFHAFNWQLWPIFAVTTPIVMVLRLLFGRKPALLGAFCGAIFPIIMILSQTKPFTVFMQTHWNPMMTALLLLCIWGVFAAYLYRVCFYKDLGTNK